MLEEIEISIRASSIVGGSITPATLSELLGVKHGVLEQIGDGHPWQAARLVILSESLSWYASEAEPSERLAESLARGMARCSDIVATIPSSVVQALLSLDIAVDLLIRVLTSEDQFDFSLSESLLRSVVSAGLPVSILSNG